MTNGMKGKQCVFNRTDCTKQHFGRIFYKALIGNHDRFHIRSNAFLDHEKHVFNNVYTETVAKTTQCLIYEGTNKLNQMFWITCSLPCLMDFTEISHITIYNYLPKTIFKRHLLSSDRKYLKNL